MKTTRRLVIGSALVLLSAYSVYTTVRIQRLESRLRQKRAEQAAVSQITYAFDDSFRQYFGEAGIAAVERALTRGVTDPQDTLRNLRHEDKLRLEIR